MPTDLDRPRQHVRTFTLVALGVSVLVAAMMWFDLFGANSDGFSEFLRWALTDAVFPLTAASLVAASLDTAAGTRGGNDRVVGIVGGLVLLSPVAGIIAANIIYGWTH